MIDKKVKFKIQGTIADGLIVDESEDYVFIICQDNENSWIPKKDIIEVI